MSSLKDNIFDALLLTALENREQRENEEIERIYKELLNGMPLKISLRTRVRMSFIRRKARRLEKLQEESKLIMRTKFTLCLIVLITLLLATIIVASANRINLFGFLFNETDTHTAISIVSTNIDKRQIAIDTELDEVYVPNCVPKGYSIKEVSTSADEIMIFYVNGERTITYHQFVINPDSDFTVDTENAKTKEIEIGDLFGLAVEKGSNAQLELHSNKYVFMFVARNTKLNELTRLAEKLENILE